MLVFIDESARVVVKHCTTRVYYLLWQRLRVLLHMLIDFTEHWAELLRRYLEVLVKEKPAGELSFHHFNRSEQSNVRGKGDQ